MGHFSDFCEPDPFDDEPTAECKNCGKAGLHWEEDDARWMLCEPNDRTHVCNPNQLQKTMINNFEVLG